MPRNRIWNEEEKQLITGVLEQYGDKPRGWPQEVHDMLRSRLADRSKDGIYQQALKMIKGRKVTENVETPQAQGFYSARGA